MKAKYNSFGPVLWLIASALFVPLVGCNEDAEVEVSARVSEAGYGKARDKAAEKTNDAQHAPKKAGDESPVTAEPKGKLEVEKTVQPGVDESIGQQVDQQRNDVSEEARAALQETENALVSLGEEKPKEALDALARAAGKLDILLARNPALSLAPTGVRVVTRNVVGTLDDIARLRDRAGDLLGKGEVQQARKILSGLASEINIGVTHIPLASYPEAIKAVSPLIDEGKMKEAKAALQAALNTLVVTEHIIPIPILRAEQILMDAEPLAEKANRSQGEKQELASLLENARYQVKLAEALGYGDKGDREMLLDQIEDIAEKTSAQQAGKGFFTGIKKTISDFKKSIFN